MSFFLHFFHFHFGYSLSLTWVTLSHTHIHWHLKAQVHWDMPVWERSWGAGLLAIDGSPFVVPGNFSRLSCLLPLLLSWVLWQLPSRQCCMLKIGRKKKKIKVIFQALKGTAQRNVDQGRHRVNCLLRTRWSSQNYQTRTCTHACVCVCVCACAWVKKGGGFHVRFLTYYPHLRVLSF